MYTHKHWTEKPFFLFRTINNIKSSGNYKYHWLLESIINTFVFMHLALFLVQTAIISVNSVKQLIFLIVNCDIISEVRTEFLSII
jgi:uncharacterized membrane protein